MHLFVTLKRGYVISRQILCCMYKKKKCGVSLGLTLQLSTTDNHYPGHLLRHTKGSGW